MPRIHPPDNKETEAMDSHLSRTDIELLVGLKSGLDTLVEQVKEFREEYKEQTASIREEQKEQFSVAMKRITDIETWKATEIQPTRIMGWDAAAKKVDDYLDDKHVTRREKIFSAVEPHINKEGSLEGLVWLARTRDRWGFMLAVIGTFLGIISGLFYWLLDHVVIPWFQSKGG